MSSDYEGCATLWDTRAGAAVSEWEAHEKRIWSVDFCAADPALFCSGSDDGWVKVHALRTLCCRAEAEESCLRHQALPRLSAGWPCGWSRPWWMCVLRAT